MSEIRLYISTTERKADVALSLMTDAFEEEGYAIATMEIDEKNDIWEASVYMFRPDEAEIHQRFAALLPVILLHTCKYHLITIISIVQGTVYTADRSCGSSCLLGNIKVCTLIGKHLGYLEALR